jgi:hypothetical protein
VRQEERKRRGGRTEGREREEGKEGGREEGKEGGEGRHLHHVVEDGHLHHEETRERKNSPDVGVLHKEMEAFHHSGFLSIFLREEGGGGGGRKK